MDTLARTVVSLVAGVVGFLVVGVGVTAALDPYVWPSAMLGLPAGLVAGVAALPLVYLWLTAREERARTGTASARTRRRIRVTAAAIAGFVAGGGLAVAVAATWAVGLATALLFVGAPAGAVTAAVAAAVVFLRDRTPGPDRTPATR